MINTNRTFFMLAAALCTVVANGATSLEVAITNPSKELRTGVGIAVPVSGMIWGRDAPLARVTLNGTSIPWQFDDMDGDGHPDELAFTVDVPAEATVTAHVTVGEGTSGSEFANATWAGLRLRDSNKRYPHADGVTFSGSDFPRATYDAILGHGIMLEGTYGGIRVYADNRQSIDLYGKPSARLELASTAFYPTGEQMAQGYGCDILWAGNSIGAGSFRAVTRDGQLATIDTVAQRTQRVVTTGPVRSVVEVATPGWHISGHTYDMIQRYTQWTGRRDIRIDVSGLDGAPVGAFATGVLKIEPDSNLGYLVNSGIALACGTNIPDKKHPELPETIAVGVTTAQRYICNVEEDSLNYLLRLVPDTSGSISYSMAFASAKEQGAPVALSDWQKYMEGLHAEVTDPCSVEISVDVPTDTVTIMMIGDSTMADKDLRGENQERGWGQMLPSLLSGPVRVDNHAVNGRSSKSFIDEGRWDKVIDKLRPGDYLVIQFGHNDEKANDPKRHTIPGSTFDDNLRRFAQEAIDKGATPILMNSIVRRNFPAPGAPAVTVADRYKKGYHPEAYASEGGLLVDTHGEYLDAPRRVAKQLNVPFIDMNAITHTAIQAIGRDASRDYYMWIPADTYPFAPEGKIDNTHLNIRGANFVANLAAQAMADTLPALRPFITVAR